MTQRTNPHGRARPRPGWRPAVLAAAVAAALAGCDSLLDVENPNQLVQEDLEQPAAAPAIVNGTLTTVARAHSYLLLMSSTISDELKWVGSRDGWREYDAGTISNASNEFADLVFPYVAEGRWMADEGVRLLTGFDAQNQLPNRNLLAQAHLYSAISYATIADLHEDFVFSNRKEAGAPFGTANMVKLYDQAIANLDKGLAVAQATGNVALRQTILAQRARTKHARGVWQKIKPSVNLASPLVNDAGAVADAEAFLALNPATDWRYRFTYSATTWQNEWGAWVNERLEMRPGDAYVVPTANDKQMASIRLRDPISNAADPAFARIVNEAVAARQYGPITVVSWREIQLILAEAALAAGNTAKFTTHVNAVRALDNLPAYSGQIPAIDLLKHMRMANLYLQNRRLSDMYRFGARSPTWMAGSEAVAKPGTLLPIANIERISNCHILGSC